MICKTQEQQEILICKLDSFRGWTEQPTVVGLTVVKKIAQKLRCYKSTSLFWRVKANRQGNNLGVTDHALIRYRVVAIFFNFISIYHLLCFVC